MNSERETLGDGNITKLVISPGNKIPIEWEKGMNAFFHYTVHAYLPQTILNSSEDSNNTSCSSKKHRVDKIMEMITKAKAASISHSENLDDAPIRQLVADSRQHDAENPFELRIGYSFSVKAMELCVKSMTVGEKSRFLCQNEYSTGYAQLEMSLRKEKQNKINVEKGLPVLSNHVCSAHCHPEFMDSLTDLQKIDGYPLEYEIELLKVLKRGDYLPEPWEMSVSERFQEAVNSKEIGNVCYKKSDFNGALAKYTRALTMIESLGSHPEIIDAKRARKLAQGQHQDARLTANHSELNFTTDDMESLDIALRLNFCACQLKLGGFNQRDPSNLKALFRRCQAYYHIGRDLDLAENDCNSVKSCLSKLDVEHKMSEWSELLKMEKLIQEKLVVHQEKEKKLYSGIFSS